MASSLPVNIPSPARIRSWKDLHTAAEALAEASTEHRYRGWRSEGRRYSANVKVHSYGDTGKAIDKLGQIPDGLKQAIQEEFTDAREHELFNEWLSGEAESLKDWFKGDQHNAPEYYDELAAKVRRGEATVYPSIEELPTLKPKLKEIDAWRKESALFLEAFRAADDGDSITWEGRSGGYITWDPRYNVEDSANEIVEWCEDALDPDIGPSEPFTSALASFRDTERIHGLNLMLIDYLEAWAKAMDFQQELDFRVQLFVEENEDDFAEEENIFDRYATLPVRFADSLAAGNCESGTNHWAAAHFPGRSEATVAEILAVEDSRPLARRACRKAIQRHLKAA